MRKKKRRREELSRRDASSPPDTRGRRAKPARVLDATLTNGTGGLSKEHPAPVAHWLAPLSELVSEPIPEEQSDGRKGQVKPFGR